MLKRFLVPVFLLVAASASAQPTISNIAPGYGGAGPNSPASFTITGTGFDTHGKHTRFVDGSGKDLFETVTCASTTSCTASGVRPFLAAAGVVSTLQVKARTFGGLSPSSVDFVYYGAPIVTGITPNNGPTGADTPYTVSGGPFTSLANGLPGTTSIQLGASTVDLTSGCGTATSCDGSAASLVAGTPQGVTQLEIRTPGGTARTSFTYGGPGQLPPTPTITGLSVPTGPSAGGNTVMISGTNFITGVQTPIPGFAVSRGTSFNVISSTGASAPVTSVNCPATTRCYVTLPAGVAGPAGFEAYTICDAGAAPCSGNTLPSVSQSSGIARGVYAYAGIKLSPGGSGPVVVSEFGNQGQGRSALYRVSLYGPPTANVHVDITAVPGIAAMSPGSLEFSPMNWAEPQTVTVTGLDDNPSAPGDTPFTIRHIPSSADSSYNGVQSDQPAINMDNDSKNVLITPVALVTTRSGGTATFTVTLTRRPSSSAGSISCDYGYASVGFTSSDSSAVTLSASGSFFATEPPYDDFTPRTVTITGHNDGTPGVRRDYTILTTSSGDPWATGCNPTGEGGYAIVVPADIHVTNIDAAGAPSGIVVTRTGLDRAVVTWNLNAASDFYRIKYSTTPGGPKTYLASSAMSGQTLTGLAFGQPYYFVMSGVNEAGESVDSAEVPFVIAAPGPPGAFDTDAKSEMTYYTPNGDWKILSSIGGYTTSSTIHLGGAGLMPVTGDYDGDQRQDVAVYDRTTGAWSILTSSSGFASSIDVVWGGIGYTPVPGDYDGDGRTDPAVYRLVDGQWSALKSSTNYTQSMVISWGGPGYTPVPGQDFDGDRISDIAVYQRKSGGWFVLKSSTNYTTTINRSWGGGEYVLVPGDYDGDGRSDFGLYQRSTGAWVVLLSGANYTTALNRSLGGPAFLPVPGDYDGDGKLDPGVFHVPTGNWFALLSSTQYSSSIVVTAWGTSADRIITTAISVGNDDASRASDYDGDHVGDMTVYNPGTGQWSTLTSSSGFVTKIDRIFGGSGYSAVPGDYDGDGRTDYGTYQPSTGNWSILLSSTNFTTLLNKSAGGPGWTPVPGDYDGDGRTDLVVYNTTTGQWFGLKSSAGYTTTLNVSYGGTGYTPVVGDFDGDTMTDICVYQQSTGYWTMLTSSSNYTSSLNQYVGGNGWQPVQGDYDGDGKTDFVVFSPFAQWYYGLLSSANYTTTISTHWGGVPTPPVFKGADYDGDGRPDLVTYFAELGSWDIVLSHTNYNQSKFETFLHRNHGGPGFIGLPQYP